MHGLNAICIMPCLGTTSVSRQLKKHPTELEVADPEPENNNRFPEK